MKPPKSTVAQKIGLLCATLSISNAMILGVDSPKAIAQETISEVDIVTFISKMEYHTNQGNVETISNLLWRNVIEVEDGEMKIIQWESVMNGYSVRMMEQ